MPKLLEQVRLHIRTLHYNIRTEEAYVFWIRDYILFNNRRHPSELREQNISNWLSHLATERNVAASTQNQALSAVLFLYREVLNISLDWINNVERAKNRHACPWFSPEMKWRPCYHVSKTPAG